MAQDEKIESKKEQAKRQIIDVCRRMDKRQFVANHDGNVSVRLNENCFVVTPTSFAKKNVNIEDLLIIDLDGKILEGKHRVFSEWKWHRAIYLNLPDATSVSHGHPPAAAARCAQPPPAYACGTPRSGTARG